LAILNNSLVALLTSLHIADITFPENHPYFDNNNYSTQATRPPFSQQLAVKVAFNRLLPQVDLFTSLKQTGWGDSFDDAGDLQSKEYQVGLIFSYPLYNTGLREG